MGFIYSTTNLITAATLHSVSTENTIYVKENLYDLRPSKPFYFTAKAAQWVKLNFAAGAQRATLACVFNHNFTNAADCHIQANAADAWGAPTFDQHLNWRDLDFYGLFDQTFAWWRLLLSDAANPYNPRIGEFFLGQWARFANAHVQPGREDGPTFFASEQQTTYGQDWDVYLSEGQIFKIRLKNINNPATIDDLHTFLRAISGPAGRFVFIPDDAQPHVYYCKVVGSPSATRLVYGEHELREWTMDIKVLTRGITIL
jgi:hypothetical protein